MNALAKLSKRELAEALLPKQFESILLELQRSLDFCQAQLHQVPPARVILDPIFSLNNELVGFLKKQMSLPIDLFDLSQSLPNDCKVDVEHQLDFLALIGAGLETDFSQAEKSDEAKN